jgi:coproporphyrinogen III oxidase-like Fe-S oxidoreductase
VTTLEGVIAADPEHLSAYALTIEEGTPLHTLVATGRVPDVDPDVQAERHGLAEERLAAAGYRRYEVSNWAKSGRASTHNTLYWSAGEYAAFGAGAHGHLGGRRWWNVRLPQRFIDAVDASVSTEAGFEIVEGDARAGEALMLGLRLTSGIPVDGFRRRFGMAPLVHRGARISALKSDGLLETDDYSLRIVPTATLLANEVAARLL